MGGALARVRTDEATGASGCPPGTIDNGALADGCGGRAASLGFGLGAGVACAAGGAGAGATGGAGAASEFAP